MSEISLTLVLQIKTSKIINDMAKVIHRRACQVGQNGKAVQTQHLFSKTLQPYLGTRIG